MNNDLRKLIRVRIAQRLQEYARLEAQRQATNLEILADEITDRLLIELPAQADPVDALATGYLLTTGEAEEISGFSDQTLRSRCEDRYSSAKRLGAFSHPSSLVSWRLSLFRLLDLVEEERGIDARREAEARADALNRRKARTAAGFLAYSKQNPKISPQIFDLPKPKAAES